VSGGTEPTDTGGEPSAEELYDLAPGVRIEPELEGEDLSVVESRAYIGFLAPGATRPFIRAAKELVETVGTIGSD
jgi:hypothetical protein